MVKVSAYPKKGVPVRDFLKQIKATKVTTERGQDKSQVHTDLASRLNQSGLYYTAKELKGGIKQDGKHFDAMVKVGAAGLNEPVAGKKDDDGKGPKGQVTMAHNRIPGRMSMYVGHQGIDNHKLLGARTLHGKDAFNKGVVTDGAQKSTNVVDGKRHNRYIDGMEKTMKEQLNREAEMSKSDGLAIAEGAYTFKDEEDGQLAQGKGTAEWFLVDWDDKVGDTGKTPHQAVMSAMGKYQPPTHNEDQPKTGMRDAKRPGKFDDMVAQGDDKGATSYGKALKPHKPLDIKTNLYSIQQNDRGPKLQWQQPRGKTFESRAPTVVEVDPTQMASTRKHGSRDTSTAKADLQELQRQLKAAQQRLWKSRGNN